MQEMKLYVLDEPILEEPTTNAPRAQRDTYIKHQNDSDDVKYLMIATMESELQKQMLDIEALIVTPQKYPRIFILIFIIYFGYKLSLSGKN